MRMDTDELEDVGSGQLEELRKIKIMLGNKNAPTSTARHDQNQTIAKIVPEKNLVPVNRIDEPVDPVTKAKSK
jgi:hypothetical protein